MKLTDFDYFLPKELIAGHPCLPRDACRLMVVDRKKQTVEHRAFRDIIEYLDPNDLLVLNDTKVLKARLLGRKQTGGKVDILLLERKSDSDFSVLVKPANLKEGQEIVFEDNQLSARLIERGIIRFNTSDPEFIYSQGHIPLPPYIKRPPEKADESDYQTVFAKKQGAIASPTAGLHFTEELLSKIKEKNIQTSYVTLHINYATFKPIKEENLLKHKMYKEYYETDQSFLELLKNTKKHNKRIFAVGTTSCRVLETIPNCPLKGWTDIFIYPGHNFKNVDCLLTNFHLPKTTLLVLVSAFAGSELIKRAYKEAVDNKYRFYSYGDAMLIV